jgi:long-chain acyl-CoA synthetase
MASWSDGAPETRYEAHFGDRVIRCYAERPRTISEMLDQAIARNPHGEALVLGDRRLTWAQVGAHVARIAAGLVACGIHPGDRIALLLENSIEFPLTLWAAVRVGAIAVPVSHRSQRDELRYILNQCGAMLIVHDSKLGVLLPTPSEVPTVLWRISIGSFPGSEDFETLQQREDGIAPARSGASKPPLFRPRGCVRSAPSIFRTSRSPRASRSWIPRCRAT